MATLQINFDQAVSLIRAIGTTNTVLLLGQPGIGKSSVLSRLAALMPDYAPAYVDCANLDLGDLGMPVIDRDRMVTNYAPNARFGVSRDSDRPVLLMLDEIGKASRPVINMLLPVMLERRIGDIPLPRGSIVFATSNLATDGVGDNIPAQGYNRMTVADMRNPYSEEWLLWAADNDIAPEVMLFARDTPEVFQRYDELKKGQTNPYIFNPLTGNTKVFCSMRQLEKASHIVKARAQLGDAFLPALAGTVGEPAARMMEANVMLNAKLPPVRLIAADPDNAPLPEGVSQYFLMALKLGSMADAKTLGAFCTYAARWTSFEASHLLTSQLSSSSRTASMVLRCREFTLLMAKHGQHV